MTAAVVTGAGRGIGRGIALRLARDGHAVAVNDVNKAAAEAVAEEITSARGRAIAVPGDVTDRDAVFAMVEQVASELGSVDVMVANAGIAQVKTLLEVTPDDLQRIFEVNIFGVVYCMQAAAERMIAQVPAARSSAPPRSPPTPASASSVTTRRRSSPCER